MKRHALMPLLRALLLTGAACALVAAAQPPAASGTNIPQTGLPVGRCLNMGNHLEPPSEGAWGRPIADDDFRIIRKAGFQTVRIPVRWTAHSDASPPFAIDPAFLARVQHVVGLARAAGLNVILNDHGFDALMADPDANRARLAGIWRQVAAHFAREPVAHLWFEIANEPHDRLTNANLVATLAPALAAIRETNPDRPVVIGGEEWSGINSLATLALPTDPNLVPTFHYYDPFDFTHQGATWVSPVRPMGRKFGSDADRAALAADVEKIRRHIVRTGMIPFMGEFGAIDKIPTSERVVWQKDVRTAFDAVGIGMCAWAFTNTFPLYDSKRRAWVPGMLDAMGLTE